LANAAAAAAAAAAAIAAAAWHTTVPARAALQRGCVGLHLANRNEMCLSGSDSYALLFLFSTRPTLHMDGFCVWVWFKKTTDVSTGPV